MNSMELHKKLSTLAFLTCVLASGAFAQENGNADEEIIIIESGDDQAREGTIIIEDAAQPEGDSIVIEPGNGDGEMISKLW